ncbi:hypothetical protein B0H14DRAFT_3148692 [Mycena olivaceomarginata]|nr:hypothetical protein B0H14DRAFT_3148692 [Mycena olivaceomarginata]
MIWVLDVVNFAAECRLEVLHKREAKYLRGNQQEEGSVQEHDVERLDGKEIARRDLMKQRINFAKNRDLQGKNLACGRSVRLDVCRSALAFSFLGIYYVILIDFAAQSGGAGYLRDNQQEDVDIQMGDLQEGSVQEDLSGLQGKNLYSEHSEHHGALPELSPMLDVSTENQHSEKMDIGAIPAYARTTLQVDFHAIPWPMIPFPQTTEVLDDILNMDPDEATEKLIKYIKPLASDMGLIRNLYIAFHPDHWSRHTYPRPNQVYRLDQQGNRGYL